MRILKKNIFYNILNTKINLGFVLLAILFSVGLTIFFFISKDLYFNNINLENLEEISNKIYIDSMYANQESASNINKLDNSIFNIFIDLFQKSGSKYKYFPSYFISTQFDLSSISLKDHSNLFTNNINIIQTITHNQYFMLEYHNEHLNKLLNDLQNIVVDYIETTTI